MTSSVYESLKCVIIGLGNGLSPVWHHYHNQCRLIFNIAHWALRHKFSDISIEFNNFPLAKLLLKMLDEIWRPFFKHINFTTIRHQLVEIMACHLADYLYNIKFSHGRHDDSNRQPWTICSTAYSDQQQKIALRAPCEENHRWLVDVDTLHKGPML